MVGTKRTPLRFPVLLFDADGTLLDYHASERQALKATLARDGYTGDAARAAAIYREVNARVWEAFERGEITQDRLRILRFELLKERLNLASTARELSETYLEDLREGGHLIPGARELLEELGNRGHLLALVTNGLKDVQYRRLEKGGILRYFRHVFVSEEMGVQKPQEEFFRRVLEVLGGPERKDCLVIGDSLSSDIRGGLNAGIATCWYSPAGGEPPSDCRPDWRIAALEELPGLLAQGDADENEVTQ